MNFEELISHVEEQARQLVWWSPDQIARGEDFENNPKKGERAWSVPRKTGEFLHDKILELKPKTILELGTSIGYSTLWIAHASEKVGAHVFTIEHSPHKFELAQENISRAELEKNVTFYLGEISNILTNSDFSKLLNDGLKIDFLFLDADRGHYHEYFPILENHLSEHATIIADNAENMHARMQPFLDLLAASAKGSGLLRQDDSKASEPRKNWNIEILNFDNGVLIATKI